MGVKRLPAEWIGLLEGMWLSSFSCMSSFIEVMNEMF